MMDFLIENQWEEMHMVELPRLRFFTPTAAFWKGLETITGFDALIDCGTGNGDLPKEAAEHGIKMMGCDIARRVGNDPCEVQIIPAHRMPFNEKIWALVCRPDHSGWCGHLQNQVFNNSGFIYVGKPDNVELDVDMGFEPDVLIEGVGEDGELLLAWYP